METTIIDDLYRYNDWANDRIITLCASLTDAQLDQARELGPGSLRATLFHVWMAEAVWLERWQGDPWRLLPTVTKANTVQQIAEGLRITAAQRRDVMNRERGDGWQRIVNYQDLRKNEYHRPLRELLLHVANHGIHHRAQLLSYLKSFGQIVPVGLDYLFYRFARPTVAQSDEATSMLRGLGVEIATAPGVSLTWDYAVIQSYYAYHDWANARIIALARALTDADLDRPFDMGPGTIRKALLHLHDAEAFWWKNWHAELSSFDHSPPNRTLADLQTSWQALASQRNEFFVGLDEAGAERTVAVSFGGPPFRCHVLESIVQLCCHGTHHRAQVINMLRQCGVNVPAFDYGVWLKEVQSI